VQSAREPDDPDFVTKLIRVLTTWTLNRPMCSTTSSRPRTRTPTLVAPVGADVDDDERL
jgi:hypothetical protein